MKKQIALDEAPKGKLGEVIMVEKIRPDGSRRIQQNFENCPSMAEQHTAHLSDINYLMAKYKPDELASYIAARNQYRQEIIGHDFSTEPNLQEAKNIIYNSKQAFQALPDEVTRQFSSHLEFLKFVDNPRNAQKLIDLGLATKRELENIQITENPKINPNPIPTPKPETPNPKP